MLDSSLDSYDRRILARLAKDGRISWRDLAEEIGLTLTPTLRRVRRLEADGYIEGFEARLNEQRLVGGMSVFISISLDNQTSEKLEAFDEAIVGMPEVMECFLMTGDADYLVRVAVRDLEHYQRIIQALTRLPGINHIKSSFAVRPVIQRRSPSVL
ncbi:Lrp/AsnC family transcriptional regulator [Sphingomonas sp. HITSZ_GF]|uniref:Lrp/AsnC family transcriptional regulator n=1 Tax=Sphingomonas sp. HITSZ_GF TaxID=3037247 RepID=UPI00240D819B|nr:Lrp/AsnC family transcriptional regulator [Sphingomonas sp. HITSZ_GF]MDG2534425.1 Lrp/AsnC family transcriptional regulator [Sphingomonas sp. HITSZ_GF]